MTWIISDALLRAYEKSNCSPEREAESSAANCSGSEPSAQLNVMPTPHPFSRNDKTMDLLRRSPFGLTYARLTESRGEAVLMWCREDSRARTSAWQGEGKESTGRDQDYGEKCGASFARFDPCLCEWKTHQLSLLGGLDSYSETWPRWGTMRNGECWERETWGLRTGVTESGFWPTPTVCGNYNRKGASATSGDGLATAVKQWPTPNASDYIQRKTSKSWALQGRVNYVLSNPEVTGVYGGQLNPEWVEWLMGWPIGWTDSKPLEMDKFREWQQQHSLKDADDWGLSE